MKAKVVSSSQVKKIKYMTYNWCLNFLPRNEADNNNLNYKCVLIERVWVVSAKEWSHLMGAWNWMSK